MLGEGFNRVASVLLLMAYCQDGILLIDEIENGIHYSVMGQVWKAIGDAAQEFNVQVFATTHSWECIRAAHQIFVTSSNYDFRLLRLDRPNSVVTARTYDREMIEASLDTGLEMR
jgi:AAA15 family ATPase/GTPase